MKRIILILVVMVLGFSLLDGCTTTPPRPSSVSVVSVVSIESINVYEPIISGDGISFSSVERTDKIAENILEIFKEKFINMLATNGVRVDAAAPVLLKIKIAVGAKSTGWQSERRFIDVHILASRGDKVLFDRSQMALIPITLKFIALDNPEVLAKRFSEPLCNMMAANGLIKAITDAGSNSTK